MKTNDPARRHSGGLLRAFTLIEMLVVIAIIALLASLLLPVLGKAKLLEHNATCIGQLRQLGIAARLYTMDNNNVLPRAEAIPTMPRDTNAPLARICDVLGPYLGKAAGTTPSALVFKCPGDQEGFYETEGSSYWWNASHCNGKPIDTPAESVTSEVQTNASGSMISFRGSRRATGVDGTVPMLIDFDDFHPRPPQSARNAVYGDGHVDRFSVLMPGTSN